MTIKPANSITEAMAALGLSRQTVYDEINSGRLRSFTVGRRRFVSGEAIHDYIHDREAETSQSAA